MFSNNNWKLTIAAVESGIVAITLVDGIDIFARVVAAISAVIIAYYSVKRLIADTKLSEEKLKILKEQNTPKNEPNTPKA